jgi:hypothetical protein
LYRRDGKFISIGGGFCSNTESLRKTLFRQRINPFGQLYFVTPQKRNMEVRKRETERNRYRETETDKVGDIEETQRGKRSERGRHTQIDTVGTIIAHNGAK